jgi:hypothetical protein
MAYHLHLYRYMTHRYRAGWSYFEDSQFVCTAKALGPSKIIEGNGYDKGPIYFFRVIVPSGTDMDEAEIAICNSLSGSSCQHDYDCCGCSTSMIDVTKVGRREFLVKESIYFNY